MGNDYDMDLGQMLILFDYNAEDGCFDIVDYLYMPRLVGVEE